MMYVGAGFYSARGRVPCAKLPGGAEPRPYGTAIVSTAPYDTASYTAGNISHALPAALGDSPAPESCRETKQ